MNNPGASTPVTVAVIGGGRRGETYSRYSLQHPEHLKIVAVAEPNDLRREQFADKFSIPPEKRFASYQELSEQDKLADAVLNCTRDRLQASSIYRNAHIWDTSPP